MGRLSKPSKRSLPLQQQAIEDTVGRSVAGAIALPAAVVYLYYTTGVSDNQPGLFAVLTAGTLLLSLVRLAVFAHVQRGGALTDGIKVLFRGSLLATGALWGFSTETIRWVAGADHIDSRMAALCLLCLAAGGMVSFFCDLPLTYGYLGFMFGPTVAGSLFDGKTPSLVIAFTLGTFGLFLAIQARRLNAEYWVARENNELLAQRAIELQQANQLAEEASNYKSAFLACMSHEIRTPINGVLGMLSIALDSRLTPDQHDMVLTARQSAESLLRIVNEILDFSKIEAGHMELVREPFSLAELLSSLEKSFAPMMAIRGLEWTVETPAPPLVLGDGVRVRQVLVNLIGNAMRFTERGSVRVAAGIMAQTDDSLTIHFQVQDTGIGIPDDKIENIFEPFIQADSSNKRRAGGTGLGLSISRRLVGLMDGRLWCESEVGVGSQFHFLVTFPLAAAADVPAPAPGLCDLEGVRILVVEDNPVNQKVFLTLLERRGALVRPAQDGQEAVAEFAAHPFDLILMDVEMPRMDGLEATAAIRARENGSGCRIPIIAMTAGAFNKDREMCFCAGMDAYMAKPILPDPFFRVIARTLFQAQASPAAPAAADPVFLATPDSAARPR